MTDQEMRKLALIVALHVQPDSPGNVDDTNVALELAGLKTRVKNGDHANVMNDAIRKEAREAGLL